jgi:hypothetical protein
MYWFFFLPLMMASMLDETRLVYDQYKCLKVVGSGYTLVYKQHGMKNIQFPKFCLLLLQHNVTAGSTLSGTPGLVAIRERFTRFYDHINSNIHNLTRVI